MGTNNAVFRRIAKGGLCLSLLAFFAAPVRAEEPGPAVPGRHDLVKVRVHRVIVEPISDQPVVILSDPLQETAMPIWIGRFEANAIQSEIENIHHPRPLTHDLLQRIMTETHMEIKRVVISDLREGIYYARLFIQRGDSVMDIDARPSDSIVMALKFKAPIFVSENLFRKTAVSLREKEEVEEQYGLTVQDLTPGLAQAFSFPSTQGILVSDVRPGSRAESDGLKRGDIFVELGGKAVQDIPGLRAALKEAGPTARAKIYRRSRFLAIAIHPG